jgi:hypothetical protein
MATAERGGSAKPFEKGLSQNFKQINSPLNPNLSFNAPFSAAYVPEKSAIYFRSVYALCPTDQTSHEKVVDKSTNL